MASALWFGCCAAALLGVEPDDLGHRRCVLGALVGVAEAYEARETQRIAALTIAHPTGVHGTACDLVGQHLDHHLRLDPRAWRDQRPHPRGPLLDCDAVAALAYGTP